MITYNDIYEACRRERYSDQLQGLPKNFVSEVSEYFKDKKEMALKDGTMFPDSVLKSKKQFENANILLKELLSLRRKKLLQLAFIASETGISKKDFENMFAFEKKLFESIMKNIEVMEKEINSHLDGKVDEVQSNVLISFKESVGEFLGLEGEKLGPFEKGQIANLPKTIADILVSDNKVDFLESS